MVLCKYYIFIYILVFFHTNFMICKICTIKNNRCDIILDYIQNKSYALSKTVNPSYRLKFSVRNEYCKHVYFRYLGFEVFETSDYTDGVKLLNEAGSRALGALTTKHYNTMQR